jgi:stage IV sporulation protein A
VPVLPVNCDQLKQKDVDGIFEKLLLSFPITELRFQMPKWLEAAEDTAEIKQHIIANARTLFLSVGTVQDILGLQQSGDEYIDDITVEQVSLADGTAQLKYQIKEHYYYDMLSNMFQKEIRNEYALFRELKLLAETRSECARISMAMKEALNAGYGTVPPEREEIVLEEPAMIKSGNRYGVKIRATAPSIHLIKANISTEIAPIVGSEEQARDLVQYIQKETEANPEAIWDVSIFGKTVSSLVEEGMSSKINKISQDCQQKLQSTMEKIVNESNGGMVCIII